MICSSSPGIVNDQKLIDLTTSRFEHLFFIVLVHQTSVLFLSDETLWAMYRQVNV